MSGGCLQMCRNIAILVMLANYHGAAQLLLLMIVVGGKNYIIGKENVMIGGQNRLIGHPY